MSGHCDNKKNKINKKKIKKKKRTSMIANAYWAPRCGASYANHQDFLKKCPESLLTNEVEAQWSSSDWS